MVWGGCSTPHSARDGPQTKNSSSPHVHSGRLRSLPSPSGLPETQRSGPDGWCLTPTPPPPGHGGGGSWGVGGAGPAAQRAEPVSAHRSPRPGPLCHTPAASGALPAGGCAAGWQRSRPRQHANPEGVSLPSLAGEARESGEPQQRSATGSGVGLGSLRGEPQAKGSSSFRHSAARSRKALSTEYGTEKQALQGGD